MRSSVILILIFTLSINLFAGMLKDEELNFSVYIPDSFNEYSEGKINPNILYSFMKTDINGEPELMINIERLGGTIGREPLRKDVELIKDILPEGSTVDIYETTWREFTIQGMVSNAMINGMPVYTNAVQLPLKGEAVQIIVGGPQAAQAAIDATSKELIKSFEGKSNWLTEDERIESLFEGVGKFFILAVLVIFWIYNSRKKRRNEKGLGIEN